VVQHHQRDQPDPQVVGEIEAVAQFSRRRGCSVFSPSDSLYVLSRCLS
jgi:hypothetical protein